MILRSIENKNIKKYLSLFPVVAILGPRQSGKTTLANGFHANHYFDLENPRDLIKLENPLLTLEDLKGLIVIDEIQIKPELFPVLRYIVDNNPKQKYLILGSASFQIIKQTSETLAGRVGFYELGGFRLHDITNDGYKKLWLRGGFPKAFLASNDQKSVLWRENFITTFLERDIPQIGVNIPANTLRRFWMMLAHYHSQIINYAELGRSFGISDMTARNYINLLEGTFMVRQLNPWATNTSKRIVKRPKLYIRDSGIFHSLISVNGYTQLTGHNKLGASWEGFALECATKSIDKRNEELFFWNTHSGAEIDLFWQHNGKNWGVEFKFSDAPSITRSLKIASEDLNLEHVWIVYPGKEKYKLNEKITVLPIAEIPGKWKYV
ncbi:MAG: ATP-binding protein [Bacteroidia bacterium]|nr:ATP-binding protein [Bacteroidia bacterium]